VLFYSWLGYMPTFELEDISARLFAVALIGTAVESLPANQIIDDNISVPFATLLVGMYLF